MTLIGKSSVQTASHGGVVVWREARVTVPAFYGIEETDIWAASVEDDRGYDYPGYGETPSEAIVDALMLLASRQPDRARQPFPEPAPETLAKPQEPVRADLPEAFWEAIREDRKITAIKELRDVSGLTLKACKALVDYIIPAGKADFSVRRAQVGTVLRIRGTAGNAVYEGWVFEKTGFDSWDTTGDLHGYGNAAVQTATEHFGFDILCIPRDH